MHLSCSVVENKCWYSIDLCWLSNFKSSEPFKVVFVNKRKKKKCVACSPFCHYLANSVFNVWISSFPSCKNRCTLLCTIPVPSTHTFIYTTNSGHNKRTLVIVKKQTLTSYESPASLLVKLSTGWFAPACPNNYYSSQNKTVLPSLLTDQADLLITLLNNS